MAKSNTEITYDMNEDILSFWRGKPSKVSVEVGDFIVDIDSQGYISGLEILNVSENFDVQPGFLNNIQSAAMSVLYRPGYAYIMLKIKLQGKDKEVSIPLTIDLGHKKIEREQIAFTA